jgi:GNAT superfamily N-acetyltransferase
VPQLFNLPVSLESAHRIDSFDCGEPALNDYLRRFAYADSRSSSSRTYVVLRDHDVIGYYTVAPGSVTFEEAPPRVAKGLARYPIPIILLARLAVDKTAQGSGLGKALLRDALLRIVQAADSIGGRAVLVHAKNDRTKAFYEQFGFEPSPIDSFHLFLLLKDLKKTLATLKA